MPRRKTIVLAEFEGVYPCDAPSPPAREGLSPIDSIRFRKLEAFALDLAGKPGADSILSLSSRKGVGKVVSAQNHVGVILFDDGSQIEILPKLARTIPPDGPSRNTELERMRATFLRMLRKAWDIDAKAATPTELRTARLPVFEAFIQMFLSAISVLVKRGLPGSYTRIEDNEQFFKGKLLAARNVRENLVRRDRFFVAHDAFCLDNPANRILRSGLDWSLRQAKHEANQRLARQLLAAFEDIPSSVNLAADFASCAAAERNADCRKAIDWCRVFLRGQSISNLAGTRHAQALLFPMETVFERYVARMIRRNAPSYLRVTIQDRSLHLFEQSPRGKAFLLKPDIVLRRAGDNENRVVVADTKWKLLCDDPACNYGISTGDMYQMYVYAKRHKAETVLLIYPFHEALGIIKDVPPYYRTPDDSDIRIMFFDLDHPNISVAPIISFWTCR